MMRYSSPQSARRHQVRSYIGRHRLSALLATTALALWASPTLAEDFVIEGVVNVENGGNVLDGGDSLTVTETGAISTVGTDAVNGTNGNDVVIDGVISSSGANSYGISLVGGVNSVLNNGVINTNGANGRGIQIEGDGDITNTENGLIATNDNSATAIKAVSQHMV